MSTTETRAPRNPRTATPATARKTTPSKHKIELRTKAGKLAGFINITKAGSKKVFGVEDVKLVPASTVTKAGFDKFAKGRITIDTDENQDWAEFDGLTEVTAGEENTKSPYVILDSDEDVVATISLTTAINKKFFGVENTYEVSTDAENVAPLLKLLNSFNVTISEPTKLGKGTGRFA